MALKRGSSPKMRKKMQKASFGPLAVVKENMKRNCETAVHQCLPKDRIYLPYDCSGGWASKQGWCCPARTKHTLRLQQKPELLQKRVIYI